MRTNRGKPRPSNPEGRGKFKTTSKGPPPANRPFEVMLHFSGNRVNQALTDLSTD